MLVVILITDGKRRATGVPLLLAGKKAEIDK
jgi:hypothetical protein